MNDDDFLRYLRWMFTITLFLVLGMIIIKCYDELGKRDIAYTAYIKETGNKNNLTKEEFIELYSRKKY